MKKTQNGSMSTKELVMYALMVALIVILQYIASITTGSFDCSINLTLVPVVIGGALLGKKAGAFLGFVSALAVLPTCKFWFTISIVGTIITVITKGILSGYLASAVYQIISKKNTFLAVFFAAIIAPVVNTGIFFIGCFLFFFNAVSSMANGENVIRFMLVGLAGVNFLFELISNILLSPAIVRIIKIRKK